MPPCVKRTPTVWMLWLPNNNKRKKRRKQPDHPSRVSSMQFWRTTIGTIHVHVSCKAAAPNSNMLKANVIDFCEACWLWKLPGLKASYVTSSAHDASFVLGFVAAAPAYSFLKFGLECSITVNNKFGSHKSHVHVLPSVLGTSIVVEHNANVASTTA